MLHLVTVNHEPHEYLSAGKQVQRSIGGKVCEILNTAHLHEPKVTPSQIDAQFLCQEPQHPFIGRTLDEQ